MKLKDMSKEDLELLSYTDLTDLILKENGKPMNTPTVFRAICDLLGYTDKEYSDKIGDYYTSLTTDRRFILLETAEWDLRDNHSIPLILEDDEDEISEVEEEEEEIEEDDEEEDIDVVVDDEEIEEVEDEMEDLSIFEEEDLDEEN